MRRICISVVLLISLLFTTIVPVYGNTTVEIEFSSENYIGEEYSIINGAPAGVIFSGEVTANGNCSIQGLVVSAIAAILMRKINVPDSYGYFVDAATLGVSYGASYLYWTRKVAYGEDSQYYYVRYRVRVYRDSAHANPVAAWRTVYSKKSKNSGASTGDDQE